MNVAMTMAMMAAIILLPLGVVLASYVVRDARTVRAIARAALVCTSALIVVLFAATRAHPSGLALALPFWHGGSLFTLTAARFPFVLATVLTATLVLATAPAPRLDVRAVRRTSLALLAVLFLYGSTDLAIQGAATIALALAVHADLVRKGASAARVATGETRLVGFLLGISALAGLAAALAAAVTLLGGSRPDGLVFESFSRDVGTQLPVVVLVPLIVSTLVRIAPFPLHSWLPITLERGSIGPASMAMLAQPSAMLMLHAALPRTHGAAVEAVGHGGGHGQAGGAGVATWVFVVASICVAGGAWAGLVAIVQRDLRRSLGYVVSSQNALALAGLVTGTHEGGVASVLFSLATAVTSVGLLLVAHALEVRAGRVDAHAQNGFARPWPRLGAMFLLLTLATIGFPGSLQFFAEDLLLQGLLAAHPFMAYAVLGVSVFNGITMLRLFVGLFFGAGARHVRDEYVPPDLGFRELAGPAGLLTMMVALVVVVPALGALIEH